MAQGVAPSAAVTHATAIGAAMALTPAWHPADLVPATASGPPAFLEQRHLLL